MGPYVPSLFSSFTREYTFFFLAPPWPPWPVVDRLPASPTPGGAATCERRGQGRAPGPGGSGGAAGCGPLRRAAMGKRGKNWGMICEKDVLNGFHIEVPPQFCECCFFFYPHGYKRFLNPVHQPKRYSTYTPT